MENNRPFWTSKYSFIITTIGSAVGLGNIWRFPYIMGQYGGAIFLAVYILIISTICFIPLMNELYIGKTTKKECVGAYESINKNFKYLDALNPITGVLIASFYFIVGGWIINYIFKSLVNSNINDWGQYFSAFIQAPVYPCILTLLFISICIFFTAKGLKNGIERANKLFMPLLAVILIFLVIVSLNLPNAQKGLEYMFKPDFSKLNFHMVLAALGQAFFTLSIGMGALLTYGSYIKEDKSLVKSVYTIILSDTAFALLAGIMIFPAVFSFNMEPNSGAGLVFVTLPKIFSNIPYGNLIAFSFFILLFSAALTSGISIIEGPCATLIERFKITRIRASIILFFIISFIAIPTTLSFSVLGDLKIFGKTLFDFLDFTTSNIMLPVNTLFLCLISGWYLKIKGGDIIRNKIGVFLFNVGLKFIVPIALVCLIYMGLK
ncbi:sodium-dependent transporter [bacterium]|nr:sodium-dependent transporter [bacterium]